MGILTMHRAPGQATVNGSCRHLLAACLLAGWAAGVAAAPVLPTAYTITDLGTFGGMSSVGNGVNDSGQVAGSAQLPDGSSRAFISDGSSLTNLGTLGGTLSSGADINATGQVAGYSRTSLSSQVQAFVSGAGGLTGLGTLGGSSSYGFGINAAGQVTGYSQLADPTRYHAFVGDAGGLTDLGTLGGSRSFGYAINDGGQVAGHSQVTGSTAYHAFVGDAISGLVDLGTLGGTHSYGSAINNLGQVAGDSYVAGTGVRHAFVSTPGGGLMDLGTLGGSWSIAHGINDLGQVVGQSDTVAGSRLFRWDPVAGMQDLSDLVIDLSGWRTLARATDISNSGYITGSGYTTGGALHAFLLTPVAAPAPVLSPLNLTGLVRYEFQGTVSSVSANLAPGLAIGDSFFATLTYDPSRAIAGTDFGVQQDHTFAGPGAGYSLAVQVGAFSGGGEDGQISILDQFAGGQDWFQTLSTPLDGWTGDAVNGLTWKQATLTLKDYAGSLYDSTELPDQIAELNHFEEAFATLFFDEFGLVNAQIERITAVITDAAREHVAGATPAEILDQAAIGGLTVVLPGATAGLFQAAFSQQAPAEAAGLPAGFVIPGDIYQAWDLEFLGTIPAGEFVELIFTYSDAGMTMAEELALDIFRVVDGRFVALGGTVDPLANTITAHTPGFSRFNLGLWAVPAPGTLLLLAGALLVAVSRRRPRSARRPDLIHPGP